MPEDKDFKRVVRARMAKTGERYTAARAELRPVPICGALDGGRPTAAARPSPLAIAFSA